ncbi:MAG TPA: FtsX-like permease family protein [Chitinophagaceae bacterium]
MWLIKLAWKNLWRNRHRTAITMAAVFFAVILATLVSSLQKGVFDNLIRNMVSFYTGYVQVHARGYWDEQVLDNSFEQRAGTEAVLLRNPGVEGLAPRLESFALAASEEVTRGCLLVGMDPEPEDRITRLKEKLVKGRYVSPADNAVLLAQGLATRLRLGVGDTVVLIGQGYHGAMAAGKYPVQGLLKFGSPDLNERAVFLPLEAARELYAAPGMLTSYVLSLSEPDELDAVATGLRGRVDSSYEVMTWEEMMPDVKQRIRTDTASMSIIIGVLYLLICFGIFGTLLMMMVERRYELGMLVAIGMKKRKLGALLLVESVFTVLTGCLLGLLTSIPLVYYLNRHPIRIGGEMARSYERFGFEAVFPTSTDASIFWTQGVIVLVLGLVLSLYPVLKVLRLEVVGAMRK